MGGGVGVVGGGWGSRVVSGGRWAVGRGVVVVVVVVVVVCGCGGGTA